MYRLYLSDTAEKALNELPRHYRKLVRDKIDALSEDPRPHGCKKLQGQAAYRLRQGPYRIVYHIDDSNLSILISNIKPRKEAYR